MLEWCSNDRVVTVWNEESRSLAFCMFSVCGGDSWFSLYLQDSRSEHERQYLFSQGHGLAENTELIKSPR